MTEAPSYAAKNLLINRSLVVGRYIEKKSRIVDDGPEIHGSQVRDALRRVLGSSPEPSGGDAGICLWDSPLISVFISYGISPGVIAVNAVRGIVYNGFP